MVWKYHTRELPPLCTSGSAHTPSQGMNLSRRRAAMLSRVSLEKALLFGVAGFENLIERMHETGHSSELSSGKL